MLFGKPLEPCKTFTDDHLMFWVVINYVVDVLGDNSRGGARFAVRWNDQVRQARHGFVLARREEFG